MQVLVFDRRPALDQEAVRVIVTPADIAQFTRRDDVKVAGLVLVRQRPGTAGGVLFMTIEDETGFANLVVFQKIFNNDYYRGAILQSRLFMATGKLQREGEVTHVIVKRCFNLSVMLSDMSEVENADQPVQVTARADEKDGNPFPAQNKRTQVRQVVQPELFPAARNFR